jgi:hypothetical protein
MTGTLDSKVIIILPNSQNFIQSSLSYHSLGKTFLSNLFSQSFTDENHGKVKNRRTQIVITVFIHLMCNKRIQTVTLLSYYHLLLSVTYLKVKNYHL